MKLRSALLPLLSLLGAKSFAATANYLGVVNKADSTASFINLETQVTEFTVKVGYLPHEITFSPDGKLAYISNYGKDHVRSTSPKNDPGTTLTVVDMEARKIKFNIDLGSVPCAPHGMVTSPDGVRLYVTCEARKEILVIDTLTHAIHTVPTSQEQSHMVVITADETRAFTSNFSSGSVSVLDLKNRETLKVITTGPGTEGISISPDEKFIYASSVLGNFFVKIDTKTLEVVGQAPTLQSPVRVIPTADGQRLVVSCSASDSLQIFDAESLTLIKDVKVGRQPIGLVVPNNSYAYSAVMLENKVSLVNLQTFAVDNSFVTGSKPDGIAFTGAK